MSLSKNLYELIHSLNKNEKGYFVKHAQSQGGNSDYLQLFHALYTLSDFDKETLIKEYPGAGFLKNLAYSQNYLYSMILKSLRLYFEKKQINIQLYTMLSEVYVLEAKGLKKQSASLLKKIKKRALKHHQYNIAIEVLKKQAIQLVATRSQNLIQETQNHYDEIFDTLKIIEEELSYRKLSHSILLCFRHGAGTSPQQFSDLLKSISNHHLLKESRTPISFFAQYLKYNIRAIEARIYGDQEIAHLNYKKILEIWEAHPAIIKTDANVYKIHISNFLGNAIRINQVDEFDKYLKVIETLGSQDEKDKIETFQNIIYFKMIFYLNQNKLKEGKKYVYSIKSKLKHYSGKLNHARAVAIYYNTLTLFFLLEGFTEAQEWANLILSEQNKTIRNDIKLFARIMQLIIHFELNHDQLLDYLHASLKRQIANKRRNQEYERFILNNFKRLINTVPGKERKLTYIQFKDDLLSFKQLEPEPISINELIIWIDAKIKKKSLQEIYSQKLGQYNF